MDAKEIKEMVKAKYSQIANGDIRVNQASCCGATVASKEVYNIMSDDYGKLDGHAEDADLGLGCGLPTEFARIKQGDTVIDLGSGAGNDAFVARHETGAEGKVIGIDFSPTMIQKARHNVEKLGYNNVEFREGDIDEMPIGDAVADVIVSNCVLNLLPDKSSIFKEIHRVLKPSGHFSISDIVLVGELPEELLKHAELFAGCVSGAIQKDDYINLVKEAGFYNITIQKEKEIILPMDILESHVTPEDIEKFKASGVGIYSITLFATKENRVIEAQQKTNNMKAEKACCGPTCC